MAKHHGHEWIHCSMFSYHILWLIIFRLLLKFCLFIQFWYSHSVSMFYSWNGNNSILHKWRIFSFVFNKTVHFHSNSTISRTSMLIIIITRNSLMYTTEPKIKRVIKHINLHKTYANLFKKFEKVPTKINNFSFGCAFFVWVCVVHAN